MDIHKMTHNGIKQFKCDICNKKYSEKGILKNPLFSSLSKKQYKCKYCQKTFKTVSPYSHMKIIHLHQRKYKCPTCFKCFGKNSILKTHLKIHSKSTAIKVRRQYTNKLTPTKIIKEISFSLIAY